MVIEWQPMETAPKDGTPILVWADYAFVAAWEPAFHARPAGFYDQSYDVATPRQEDMTHWARILPPAEYRIRRGL